MRVRAFLQDESGVVTADWVVLSAGIVVLGIGTLSISSGGVENAADAIRDELLSESAVADYRYFGQTYEDYIRGITWVSRTTEQQLDLFYTLADPAQRTDHELLSEYQLWSDLAADENYADPELAAERVALIQVALDARGLEPVA